jgi:hypothetical protein
MMMLQPQETKHLPMAFRKQTAVVVAALAAVLEAVALLLEMVEIMVMEAMEVVVLEAMEAAWRIWALHEKVNEILGVE